MMRCMVVDDDEVCRLLLMHYVDQHEGLSLVASCASAIEAANVLRRERVDLLFLDIEMPGMSGLELLRTLSERPQVVLVTGKEGYALEAFDLEVTDYLLKPAQHAAFLRAVARAERRAQAPGRVGSDRHLFVRQDGRLVKLDLTEVRRIEAKGDYVYIHTSAGSRLVHSTMKALEAKLPPDDFVRVHRSHIVRVDQIVDLDDTTVVVGRDVVPLSEAGRAELLRRLRTL